MKKLPENFPDENAYEDLTHSGRKMKPKGKVRKPFTIQSRYIDRKSRSLSMRWLHKWWTHSCYETATRRDQAYAALVKKEENAAIFWSKKEYRKVDK